MPIIRNLIKKTEQNRPLYAQILFAALAFFMMVIFSYILVSNIVHKNIRRNAESLFSTAQVQIDSQLLESRVILGGFSRTVRSMILGGYDVKKLQDHFDDITKYLQLGKEEYASSIGVFGYFETLPGGPILLEGFEWERPEDYIPVERNWYLKAVMAGGGIAETLSFHDIITQEPVLIYSLCIYDEEGRQLGVIGHRVSIDAIRKYVVDINLEQGGNGILISQDMIVIAHCNPDFVGYDLHNPAIPISIYADDIFTGSELFERTMKNWKGENVVVFLRKLPGGWYLGLMTPKTEFYQSVRNMAFFLGALGVVFATALILVLIHVDSARKKSDKESRHKSVFLANMSHEIRTPMNAIIGMTVIGKDSADPERKNYCFSKIEDASNHLLGVINDILDMSKIEANKFELSPEEFNFEKMLKRVVNVINFRVEEKQQKLSIHIDKAIPKNITGDDQRLAQVITNLLGNAVKFTPNSGSIRLDASLLEAKDGYCTIKISVTDKGIGIDPKQQKRLFGSFEQAESSISRKFGGTGLGLSISKSIVEMMGGKIWVESELGKGATFAFTIRAEYDTEKRRVHLLPGLSRDNIQILAVDNDQEVLDSLTEIAQSLGLSCDTATNAEETLKMVAEKGSYHIYFVDWKLSGMDSIQLTRELKAQAPENSVVIMISAADWGFVEEEAKKAGVKKILSKPLFPSDITDAIMESLGHNPWPKENVQEDINGIFEGRRVLIVEDVEINREILTSLLEPALLEIDCAENGIEAVRMFAETPEKYDLILMDIQMPEMDGYEATKRIRALEADMEEKSDISFGQNSHATQRNSRVPIIAMTANVFREDIEKCLEAGMNNHLGKPIDINEVFYMLRSYLPQKTTKKIA